MYFIAVLFDYEQITSGVKGQGSGRSWTDVRRTGELRDSASEEVDKEECCSGIVKQFR